MTAAHDRWPPQSRQRIAVIGAGAFGSTAALGLASDGHPVTVFERRDDILLGASKNNQNRLHLGFHYPRDLKTARQCKEGFDRFVRMFPECISGDFPNQYFVAASGSLTTPDGYLRFLDRAGLPYRRIALDKQSDVRHCELGVLSEEVVYDHGILRATLARRLGAAGLITVRTRSEIVEIDHGPEGYRLRTASEGWTERFDVVVNCSYDEIDRLTAQLGHPVEEHQFEYTVIPIVQLDMPRTGITIMDGPFMTMLPYGMSSDHLLYHVDLTVIARVRASTRDPRWGDPSTGPFATMEKDAFFDRMRDACTEFVPAIGRARLRGFLEGPRMVLARREHDDARPSVVRDHGDGYMTVFAGKIDHCAWVADEIRSRVIGAR